MGWCMLLLEETVHSCLIGPRGPGGLLGKVAKHGRRQAEHLAGQGRVERLYEAQAHHCIQRGTAQARDPQPGPNKWACTPCGHPSGHLGGPSQGWAHVPLLRQQCARENQLSAGSASSRLGFWLCPQGSVHRLLPLKKAERKESWLVGDEPRQAGRTGEHMRSLEPVL